MQLHCIPRRTMRTIVAERATPTAQERIVQLRHVLLTLRGHLQELDTTFGHNIPSEARRDGLRWQDTNSGHRPHLSNLDSSHGHVYKRPAKLSRSVELVIPPRARYDRCPASHTISETAGAHDVRIVFPVEIGAGDIHWEIHGDVLEVEYLGQSFTYYHAFIVPQGTEPVVEQWGRDLSFHFPKCADGA